MLSGLYYPFSRCIDSTALKRLLLVFDRVGFLDPVTDEGWRANLLDDLAREDDARFAAYRESLFSPIQELMEEGFVQVHSPADFPGLNSTEVASAAVSDLMDHDWRRLAADPSRYALFAEEASGRPIWQIFQDKIPSSFVDASAEHEELRQHVVWRGTRTSAWGLSYEAGSALALNSHLAAASSLGFSPVTDSELHHHLLMRKLARTLAAGVPEPESGAFATGENFAHATAIRVLREVVPDRILQASSFEDVVKFRDQTSGARREFVDALRQRFAGLAAASPVELQQLQAETVRELLGELRAYQHAVAETRGQVWPAAITAGQVATGGASAGGLLLAALGQAPGQLLASSVALGALALLGAAAKLKVVEETAPLAAPPEVAFLAKAAKLGRG